MTEHHNTPLARKAFNPIKWLLSYPERKRLTQAYVEAVSAHRLARQRYMRACKRKTTQIQHDAARDVKAALEHCLRIELSLAALNSGAGASPWPKAGA